MQTLANLSKMFSNDVLSLHKNENIVQFPILPPLCSRGGYAEYGKQEESIYIQTTN